jgi:hypothetical protein
MYDDGAYAETNVNVSDVEIEIEIARSEKNEHIQAKYPDGAHTVRSEQIRAWPLSGEIASFDAKT